MRFSHKMQNPMRYLRVTIRIPTHEDLLAAKIWAFRHEKSRVNLVGSENRI